MRAAVNATYDMQLTVFAGECGALSCVDGTDGEEQDFLAGSVTWGSVAGQQYSIFGECQASSGARKKGGEETFKARFPRVAHPLVVDVSSPWLWW
jgi:hypothetical protein